MLLITQHNIGYNKERKYHFLKNEEHNSEYNREKGRKAKSKKTDKSQKKSKESIV